ncbi:MAG: tRNA dimethylallyltransferase, partial [Rhodospirillales bacterium]|nr:tRNA dimethylallyltransferase [Rhodospirillales bacterium]
PIPPEIRRRARALHGELGGQAFRERLAARDPLGAERLAPGDTQRLIRAWEVIEASGRALHEWQGAEAPKPPIRARFRIIVLNPPRDVLGAAIEARVARMIKQGAIDEARALIALGLDDQLPAMKALGVAQLGALAPGGADQGEAARALATATRQYAKRQTTWNRGQIVKGEWINAQYSESIREKIFSIIRNFLLTTK